MLQWRQPPFLGFQLDEYEAPTPDGADVGEAGAVALERRPPRAVEAPQRAEVTGEPAVQVRELEHGRRELALGRLNERGGELGHQLLIVHD